MILFLNSKMFLKILSRIRSNDSPGRFLFFGKRPRPLTFRSLLLSRRGDDHDLIKHSVLRTTAGSKLCFFLPRDVDEEESESAEEIDSIPPIIFGARTLGGARRTKCVCAKLALAALLSGTGETRPGGHTWPGD